MNRNLDLRSRGHSQIGKLSSFAIVIVVIGSIIGCNPLSSSGTRGPQITIQNVNAYRDQMTQFPVVTMDYTVKYPSDLYAQTLVSVPTLTCTMEQKQLTQVRTFTGAPVSITGSSSAPQSGQVSILVPEDGKSIAGSFSVICTLASDRTLGTSNEAYVEVPEPPDPLVEKSYVISGDWKLTWTWTVTTVFFVGTVTGGPDQWNFQGSLEGGGSSSWRPPKGSGTAKCTLTGRPSTPGSAGQMSCDVTWTDQQNWTGKSDGTIADYFTSASKW
ncbi:hypothetical protein LCGC14_1644910, partial [marine sediment metagenome]